MSNNRQLGWGNRANPLQEEIKQVFDRFFGETEGDASSVVTSQWVPRVDIKEEPNRFVILADLPGVDPNAIEVHRERQPEAPHRHHKHEHGRPERHPDRLASVAHPHGDREERKRREELV